MENNTIESEYSGSLFCLIISDFIRKYVNFTKTFDLLTSLLVTTILQIHGLNCRKLTQSYLDLSLQLPFSVLTPEGVLPVKRKNTYHARKHIYIANYLWHSLGTVHIICYEIEYIRNMYLTMDHTAPLIRLGIQQGMSLEFIFPNKKSGSHPPILHFMI